MRRTLCLLSLASLLLVPFRSEASTLWTVRLDGSGDFTTVAGAVAVAQDGDIIEIGPGTHGFTEQIDVDQSLTFRSSDGPEFTTLTRVGGRPFRFLDGESQFLDLTMADCDGPDLHGSVMSVKLTAEVTVRRCVFRDNLAGRGGAIKATENGWVYIYDSLFERNDGPTGGGALTACLGGNFVVRGSTFVGNTSSSLGGAIEILNGTLDMAGCLFVDNDGGIPGAVHVWRSRATVTNSTFYGNISGTSRGALMINESPNSVVTGNIFAGNLGGSGLHIQFSPGTTHECNLFWNNANGPTSGVPLDPTEFQADPQFCDPASGDFGLLATSPALAANNACALDLGAFSQGCAPQPAVQVIVGTGRGQTGETVSIPVDVLLTPAPKRVAGDLSALDLTLSWEAAFGTVVDVRTAEATTGWQLAFNPTPGSVQVSMAGLTPVSIGPDASTVVWIDFVIAAEDGATELAVDTSSLFDTQLMAIDHEASPGLVEVDCEKGDVLADGVVNSADGLLTLQIAVEQVLPTPLQACRADMDSDGSVTAGDGVAVLRRAVGLGERTVTATAPSAVFRSESSSIVAQFGGISGAQFVVEVQPASVALGGTQSPDLMVSHSPQPGRWNVATATVNSLSEGRLDFEVPGAAVARILSFQAFDGAGLPVMASLEAGRLTLGRMQAPRELDFVQASPNPFNPRTRIEFDLSKGSSARLEAFDAHGRRVWYRQMEGLGAGRHSLVWEGRDSRGRPLASGVYSVRITAGAAQRTTSVTLLK